jgi:hypothetical protein
MSLTVPVVKSRCGLAAGRRETSLPLAARIGFSSLNSEMNVRYP